MLDQDVAAEVEATTIDEALIATVARYRRAAILLAVALVCIVYVASALTWGRTLRSTAEPSGFHALVANALLHHQLVVLPTPPGLTDLQDPWDPDENRAFRDAGYHDLAFYKGHLYTTSGPTTALIFHVPSRLLGFGNMNPNLATLLGALGGFVAAVAAFEELRRRFCPGLPLWAELLIVLVLGLGSPVLWLVSIGRSYESAIACGYMLVAAGAYALLRALRDVKKPVRSLLVVGAASLALSVGARVVYITTIILVAAAVYVVIRAHSGQKNWRSALVCLLIPYALVGASLAAYNYARFDSLTEFGTSYQLSGVNARENTGYEPSYVLPNLGDYVLSAPRMEATYPYVHLRTNTFTNDPTVHSHEPVAGMLLLFPFISLGLVLAVAMLRRIVRERPLAAIVGTGLAFGTATLLGVSLPYNATTMRYAVDFVPAFLLVAALVWSWAYSTTMTAKKARLLLGGLGVATGALSVLVGVALVLTSCPGTGSC